jgi:hypothetical protein
MPSSTGWGKVRGSPYGSSATAARNGAATSVPSSSSSSGGAGGAPLGTRSRTESDDDEDWLDWRSQHLPPVHFPVDGYDHQNGQAVIDQVDSVPLGCNSSSISSAAAAAAATMPASLVSSLVDKQFQKKQQEQERREQDQDEAVLIGPKEVHDYGSTKTIDDAPVGSLRDKWRLMPVSNIYIALSCFD